MAKAFIAGVVSLLFVAGAPARTAVADPAPAASDRPAGVVQLFGKTLCFPNAPTDARCDWRIPAEEREPASAPDRAGRFRMLGLTWCLGEVADDPACDFRLPRQEVDRRLRASR